MNLSEISDDPKIYGSKGHSWSAEFVTYMKEIVTHPNYAGMPDAVGEDGKIQWEAPSNRSAGKYQYTHQKRLDWWRSKARSIGVDVSAGRWISRTAKLIHPTGTKPCKRCGSTLRIGYAYPSKILLNRFLEVFGEPLEIIEHEEIENLIERASAVDNEVLFSSLGYLLKAKNHLIPEFGDMDEVKDWLLATYIPSEPSTLSPGAMSNAPDRLDGFHSFNRCCRGSADPGRLAKNLKTYVTDRRVFEFWSEGDWVAADRLMGLVRTELSTEECADGGDGPPTADHIGPLSLGFCHRPEFRLLSGRANSAKNNRMTLDDVRHLEACEKKSEQILTWYAQPLWNRLKDFVETEEHAQRISKTLRDNQRIAMKILARMFSERCLAFLVYLLELKYAKSDIVFVELRAENFITVYSELRRKQRDTKYSIQQQARRIRVGFESLRSFMEKENRHMTLRANPEADEFVHAALRILKDYHNASNCDQYQSVVKSIDDRLAGIVFGSRAVEFDTEVMQLVPEFPMETIPVFEDAKSHLGKAMGLVADTISREWGTDRYVREERVLD